MQAKNRALDVTQLARKQHEARLPPPGREDHVAYVQVQPLLRRLLRLRPRLPQRPHQKAILLQVFADQQLIHRLHRPKPIPSKLLLERRISNQHPKPFPQGGPASSRTVSPTTRYAPAPQSLQIARTKSRSADSTVSAKPIRRMTTKRITPDLTFLSNCIALMSFSVESGLRKLVGK